MIDRKDYIYQVYFYTTNKVLFLENELIFDINLEKSSSSKVEDDLMLIEFQDEFFVEELNEVIEEDFIIIAQVFNKDLGFIQQIDLSSESIKVSNNKLVVTFESININKAWNSVNPKWISLANDYKYRRVSNLRKNAIETLLK